jgi:hypothetical protein
MMSMPATDVSIPRYAPLSNMVLAFDGSATIAQALLPAGLIPANGGPVPFSMTFWMNPQPTLETPEGQDGEPQPRLSGPMVVADIRGQQGALVTWSISVDLTLSYSVEGKTPFEFGVNIAPHLSQWIFVASAFSPPSDGNPHGEVSLMVSSGAQMTTPFVAPLDWTPSPSPQDRWLTVGNLPFGQFQSQKLEDLGPFQGMIGQMRLWNVALSQTEIETHMYYDPIGPKAYVPGPVIGDWRMNEGYGTTAFDYASPGSPLIPVRYQPPPGNHMRLGTGDPATEPAWVIADVLTQVQKNTSVQVTTPVPQPLFRRTPSDQEGANVP